MKEAENEVEKEVEEEEEGAVGSIGCRLLLLECDNDRGEEIPSQVECSGRGRGGGIDVVDVKVVLCIDVVCSVVCSGID